MEGIITTFGIVKFILTVIGLAIVPYFGLYWMMKLAVKNGVKEALKDESIKEVNRETVKKGSLDAIRQINFDALAKKIGAEVRINQAAPVRPAEPKKDNGI